MFYSISNKISSITPHWTVRNFRRVNGLTKKEGESGKPKATPSSSGMRA